MRALPAPSKTPALARTWAPENSFTTPSALVRPCPASLRNSSSSVGNLNRGRHSATDPLGEDRGLRGEVSSFKLGAAVRDKIYLVSFLLLAGLLLYTGRGLLPNSVVVAWGLTFAGTTAAGVLGMVLYRVQLELRASRHELARKEAELSIAREIQGALFPKQFPADSGLEFAGVYVPAKGISGDYYDVLPTGNGLVVFAIADISGKGVSAAILMSNLHAVLRTLALTGHSPVEVCSQLNRHLHQVTDGARFATMFYAEWHASERRLSYINGGHNAPILLGSRDSRRLAAGGPPLGIFLDYEFRVSDVILEPGDMIVAYSDGVTEAGTVREEEFGESRLEDFITRNRHKPLTEIAEQVLAAVRKWAGEEPEDDMTLLLVRALAAR